ncbi:MAG: membrane-associated HD superfamily phosphohydrolase [Bacteroidia bacterium]|jgi:membrane-associated HD superfamily phosphohydrolase
MPQKYLDELHKEYTKWTKALNFYKDEIKTFKHRLEEIITQNTKIEVTAQVEHFQNQFIRQNEVIDILKHDIHEAEHKLVLNAKENNVATDHRKTEEDVALAEQMTVFEKIYLDLKAEFSRFAADTL